MGGSIALVLLGALALLLVSAGLQDVRTREIANWKNAAIALLAPAWWWANGYSLWPEVATQLGIAAAVFALFAAAFYLKAMGGGDVKMIAALALWLPFGSLVWMLVLMSIIGGVITLALVLESRMHRQRTVPEIPYGVAIAIAGLLALREPILNGFA
jgi:prepilin peptidase CpaA